DVRGGFFDQAGDNAKLVNVGGQYQVTEADGTSMVFRKDGLFDHIEDLNGNRITATYEGSLLTSLDHSAGQNLKLAYIGDLLRSVTDSSGRVVTYSYDGVQH